MGLLYDFTRLIEKYSVSCELIRESGGGSYVGGNWIPDPAKPPETVEGALIPMKDQKIYQSGGTYTQNDREFITVTAILLEPAAYVIFQGIKYHVESENDYSIYAGFHDYNLKRVEAFDRAETN
ncbi:MAG: hypothetical protein Q4C66_15160 [Lachnospiraceae bacterium]|nr:hypothetical protein [Lachnospiraceae bacterium]